MYIREKSTSSGSGVIASFRCMIVVRFTRLCFGYEVYTKLKRTIQKYDVNGQTFKFCS